MPWNRVITPGCGQHTPLGRAAATVPGTAETDYLACWLIEACAAADAETEASTAAAGESTAAAAAEPPPPLPPHAEGSPTGDTAFGPHAALFLQSLPTPAEFGHLPSQWCAADREHLAGSHVGLVSARRCVVGAAIHK